MHPGAIPYFTQGDDFPFQYRRWWPRSFEWSPLQGVLTAAALRTDSPPKPEMRAQAAAGAQMAEGVEDVGVFPPLSEDMIGDRSQGFGLWTYPMIAWTRMRELSRDAGNATAELGLEIGSFNVAPPFAVSANRDVVQLFTEMGTPSWKFRVNTSVGAGTLTLNTLAGVSAPGTVNAIYHLMIVYVPGQYVQAYVDGVLGFEQTTNLPDVTQVNARGVGVYACHQGAVADVAGRFLYPTILTGGVVS